MYVFTCTYVHTYICTYSPFVAAPLRFAVELATKPHAVPPRPHKSCHSLTDGRPRATVSVEFGQRSKIPPQNKCREFDGQARNGTHHPQHQLGPCGPSAAAPHSRDASRPHRSLKALWCRVLSQPGRKFPGGGGRHEMKSSNGCIASPSPASIFSAHYQLAAA